MSENDDIIEIFKKSISATVKSIGKNDKAEINFVNKDPGVQGNQINLLFPEISKFFIFNNITKHAYNDSFLNKKV